MKRITALLVATVIICTTPSLAVELSADSQNISIMNIRGKGTDPSLEIPPENETAELTTLPEDNSTLNISQEDYSPMNLSDDGINESESLPDVSVPLNTTGVVMQTTNYTCGPASLATVLNNLGFNATEMELAALAGTDENGTTMYGLLQAAKSKGLNATGMKIASNDLKSNNIVYMTVNGGAHYSVILEMNNETVLLADPSLGNINITREEFEEKYNGYAMVLDDPKTGSMERSTGNTENDPNSSSGAGAPENPPDTCNDTNSTLANPQNRILSQDEMMGIKGKRWKSKKKKKSKWKAPKIQCSYKWKGWGRVKNRIYYGGGKIIAGLCGSCSGFGAPAGLYLIWEGMNEYKAHYKDVC